MDNAKQDQGAASEGTSASHCWAVPGWEDGFGNVKCSKCGKVQSPTFNACVACCPHNTLDFIEDWHGPDEGGRWELDVECADCGKNFDFAIDDIIDNYQAIRRKPNAGLHGAPGASTTKED